MHIIWRVLVEWESLMYVIRRVAKTKPGKAWEVAGHLTKICRAYEEETGRNKAVIYVEGQGLPGTANVVYAEWIQDTIEELPFEKVPKSVLETGSKLMEEFPIEFYQVATPEQLQARGFG